MTIKKVLLWILKHSALGFLFKAKPNKETNEFIKQISGFKPGGKQNETS